MALTRSQLLAGNQAQGTVLNGEVQAVKQGTGILIEPDGTIKVNAATVEGLLKLNNPLAFNSYVWPPSSGSPGTFLSDDGNGNLEWLTPSVSSTVSVGNTAPTGSLIGRLWFDTTEYILKVFEGGPEGTDPAGWTPVYRGLDADAVNTTSLPEFQSGDGSEAEPFTLGTVSVLGGSFVRFEEVIKIEGFAPYQYVPIIDLNAEENGNRFSSSSYFTDGNGVLTFRVLFTDYPVSRGGIGYTANLEVGFGSVFVSATCIVSTSLKLTNTGTITGSPQVGQILEYSVGQAEGGTPPYQYEWEWRRASDDGLLQENGDTFRVQDGLDGDRIFVRLVATDRNNIQAIGSTADYPTAPQMIMKGPFPFTNILFPTSLNQEVTTTWLDESTQLVADGCIEISVKPTSESVFGPWGQGPFTLDNGGHVKTRWAAGASCGGAPNGTLLEGCVFDDRYRECGSLIIDRIPSPFSFIPMSDLQPNTIATALPITPVGYNGAAYITYTGISSLTSIQGSLNNGQTWVNVPLVNSANEKNFPIQPGQSLIIRGTTGSAASATYNAVINIGEGPSVQSATFTATNTGQTSFDTNVRFPTTTEQGYGTVPGAASPSWEDGSTTLTATGCVEIQVESSGGTVISAWGTGPFAIQDGQILRTRWDDSASCGGSEHGKTISGTVTNVPSGGTKTSQGSLMVDRVVGAFSFQDVTGQQTSAVVTSNTVNLSGANAPTFLTATGTLTGIEASINGGSWQSVPTSGTSFEVKPAAPGDPSVTLQVRGTTGATGATEYTATVVVGSNGFRTTDTWSVTTSGAVKTVITPSITSPLNGATGINPTALNPAGINATSSAYEAINGASTTQLNSEWELRSGSTSGTVVYSETKTSNFTSWFIPETDGSNTVLTPNTQYFLRVRYTSQDGVVSDWSPFSQFRTAGVFSLTWVYRGKLPVANTPEGYNLIANDGSLWMALAGTAGAQNFYAVLTSSDAISWSASGSIQVPLGGIQSLSVGGGLWLTVGIGAQSVRRSSNNGASWVTPANTNLTSTTLRSIAHNGDNTFVAVGGSVIQTTVDGNVWTTRPTPQGVTDLSSVIWDGSNFIAVGDRSLIYSPTGTSWTRVNTPQAGSYQQIVYLPGATPQYLLLRPYFDPLTGQENPGTTAYTSTNFTSWTAQTLPSNSIQYAAAGNGVFVVGYWTPNPVFPRGVREAWVSPSGLTNTWIPRILPSSTGRYQTRFLNFGTSSSGVGRFVLIDQEQNIHSTV